MLRNFACLLVSLFMVIVRTNTVLADTKHFGDDCTSSAECDYNLYCDMSDPEFSTCSFCTKPENSDWDRNRTRNGDGETSCPWKCDTGYYEYGDLCYECPYGSTSDGTNCYWEKNTNTFYEGDVEINDGQPIIWPSNNQLKLSESLLEKARAQQ